MSKGLEIYACSGVGATEEQKQLTYYLEGTQTATNTQAQNNLLSYLNEKNTELEYLCATDSERAQCLNMMDLYAVCFYFASAYKQDTDRLRKVGYILSSYVDNGRFSGKSSKIADHDKIIGAIIDEVEQYSGDVMEVDTTFSLWFFDNVLALNKVGLTAEQQQAGAAALTEPINGTNEYGDLSQYFNKAGSYFLYLYFTDEQMKRLPRIFAIKRRKQQEVYNYCLNIFTQIYGDEAAMQRIIRNGIIQDYKATPEEVVDKIMGDPKQGIGFVLTTNVIIAIVLAVAAVVGAAILGVIEYAKAIQVAKYTVPDDTNSGVPEAEIRQWVERRNSNNNMWLLAGIGSLAFVLLSNSKGKHKRK